MPGYRLLARYALVLALVLSEASVHFGFGLLFGVAVLLRDAPYQLVTLAGYFVEVVIGEIPPPFLDFTSDLLPLPCKTSAFIPLSSSYMVQRMYRAVSAAISGTCFDHNAASPWLLMPSACITAFAESRQYSCQISRMTRLPPQGRQRNPAPSLGHLREHHASPPSRQPRNAAASGLDVS